MTGFLHYKANVRDFDTEELVALTVLPWAGLEEAHEMTGLLRVTHGLHGGDDVCGLYLHSIV